MTTVTFDTHLFIKRLTAAGMPESQAETVTDLVKEAQETAGGDLSTKADIASLRVEMQLLEQRMTIKLGGLIVAATGLLLAAMRYLPPH